jgi:hypothetical protein
MSIYEFLQLSSGYNKLDEEIKKIKDTIMNIDPKYKNFDIFEIPFEFKIQNNVVRKNFDVYDLQLLLNEEGRYLNSAIIQAYATLIAKTKSPNYQILQIGEGKCTKQFSTGEGLTDFLVVYNIPLSHWVLAHTKRSNFDAMIYDSSPASTNLQTMKKCVKQILPVKTMIPQEAPKQQSGKNECGLYVMLSMNAIMYNQYEKWKEQINGESDIDDYLNMCRRVFLAQLFLKKILA